MLRKQMLLGDASPTRAILFDAVDEEADPDNEQDRG
jgi:hypothetical protein